jgi:hypothetical protein
MSLSDCFKKLKLSEDVVKRINKDVKKFIKKGMGQSEAEQTAIDSVIEETKNELESVKEKLGIKDSKIEIVVDEVRSFDQSRKSKKETVDNNLITMNNISEENLKQALELGGLAMPSLGITNKNNPYSSFGEISLLASPDILNSEGVKTFDADVYSPRFPQTRNEVNEKAIKAHEKKLGSMRSKVTDEYYDTFNRDELATSGLYHVDKSLLIREKYLEEKSIKVEIPRIESNKELENKYPELYKLIEESGDFYTAKYGREEGKSEENLEKFKKLITEYIIEDYKETYPEDPELAKTLADDLINDPNYFAGKRDSFDGFGIFRKFESAISDNRSAGKVDKYEYKNIIDQKIKDNISDFESWLQKNYADVLGEKALAKYFGPTNTRGSRWKLTPLTLDNVVSEMKKSSIRGGESFMSGPGTVRAMLAKEFKSIKKIQENRDRVVSKAEMEKAKVKLDALYSEATKMLDPGGFNSGSILEDIAKMGFARVEKDLGREIKNKAAIQKYFTALQEAPTEYFEAKAKRAVTFDEFKAAVVPEKIDKSIVDQLKKAGLKIYYYSGDSDSQDRVSKINQAGKENNIFFQGADTRRGSIEFRKEEKIITLHKEADRSTFLHEMGHLFLQDFYEHVLSGDASNRAINDWMKLSAWLDYNPAQTELTVEQHEKWARGFEAYLMEGKAPSRGLQKTFSSFRKWLTRIYKSVASLDVELSDDVREIMGRMLATDEEITLARRKTGLEIKIDLTEIPKEVIGKLESIKAMAEEKAFAMLFKEQMRDITQEHKDFIKSKAKEVAAQVKFEIENSPEGQEILDLQKMLKTKDLKKKADEFIAGDITEEQSVAFEMLAEDMGYSSGDHLAKAMLQMVPIADQIKAEVENRMKEFSASTDQDVIRENAMRAIHNEKSIELLGMEKEVFRKLLSEETEKENQKIIAAMEKYDDETLRKWLDAKEKLTSNKINKLQKEVTRLMDREFERKIREDQKKLITQWLAAKDENVKKEKLKEFRESINELNKVIAGYTRREAELVKIKASEILNSKSIKEASKFTQYFTAERNAALRVAKAVSKNDWGEAIVAKKEQMLNHALARESIRISREVKRHSKYLNDQRTASRETFKNEDHLFQASKILERFGFTRSDFDPNSTGETLAQWETKYEQMNAVIADWLLDERIIKKTNELSISELRDVRNAVQNIKKVANFENEISALDGKRKIEEIATELIQASQKNFNPKERFKNKFEETKIDKLKGFARLYMFSLKKVESVIGPLDAWRDNGPWARIFKDSVYNAANEESRMIQNATKEISKNWDIYTKKERKDIYNKKIYIPEWNISTTKDKLLAMGHNLGNEGNRERLFATRPVGLDQSIAWGEGMVMTILQRELDAKDWKFIQSNWDHLETYWPKISALHKKLTGFTPGKVEHLKFSVVLKDGTKLDLDGGYYPLKSDPRNSFKDEVRANADDPLYKEQNMAWKAATKKGHTKERVNAQYPVSLDLGIINRHLQDVIHDLAFRENVIELNKLISREDMQAEMKATLTPEGYKTIKEYIGATAGGQGGDPVSAIDKVVKVLRQNTTKAALFWKVSVISQNFANALIFPNAVEGFGYADAFKSYLKYGISDYTIKLFSGEAKEIREMVYSKSAFMKDRADSPDYSIEEVHSKFSKNEVSEISKMAGGMMAWTDEFSNIPMWLGAYNKAIDEGKGESDAVRFADNLIMRVAGSSRKYDVASISRGTETQKIFSMFFSWMNTEHNRWMREMGILKRDKDVSRALGFLAGRLVFQVIGAALMFRLPDLEDEEEVKKFIANMTIGFPLGFFPGIRDVATVASDKLIGVKGFGYNPSPAFAAIDYGLGGFGAIVDAAEGNIDEKVAAEKVSKAAAYGFGYPDQFNQWFFNLYDYTEGMEPKIQDIYRRRPKDERK